MSAPEVQNAVVVSVTYGDRIHHVERMLYQIEQCGIKQLYLVDNAVPADSEEKLAGVVSRSNIEISVIRHAQNEGSAGGFASGIAAAREQPSVEWIWLLDDDNVPEEDAFEELCRAFKQSGLSNTDALLSLRVDRSEYVSAFEREVHVGIQPNSFMGFSFLRHLKQRFRSKGLARRSGGSPLVQLGYAPYGGLLMSTQSIERVGLPDERLFLYGDDHEFTIRHLMNGGRIFLVGSSVVRDGEQSWDSSSRGDSRVAPIFSRNSPDLYAYYLVRNRAYVEKKLLTSYVSYAANTAASLAIAATKAALLQRSPLFVLRRLRLVLHAISAAWRDRLGRVGA